MKPPTRVATWPSGLERVTVALGTILGSCAAGGAKQRIISKSSAIITSVQIAAEPSSLAQVGNATDGKFEHLWFTFLEREGATQPLKFRAAFHSIGVFAGLEIQNHTAFTSEMVPKERQASGFYRLALGVGQMHAAGGRLTLPIVYIDLQPDHFRGCNVCYQ